MQDMRHFLPDYLTQFYLSHGRGADDIRVKICHSFQKSMFCVTSAALQGLLPFAADTDNAEEQAANRQFLLAW
ncbi:CO2 hydration protein, partial [Haemophilus parainfluenzae]|uniref:CO2 hydration protein n=1 Tax=Haemophilus parainfluenzae TaxID=729 RepID=UPI0021F0B3D0